MQQGSVLKKYLVKPFDVLMDFKKQENYCQGGIRILKIDVNQEEMAKIS